MVDFISLLYLFDVRSCWSSIVCNLVLHPEMVKTVAATRS